MSYKLDQVYNNLKYIVTSNSSAQVGSTTDGVASIINGSEIDYIPESSATKVIYEISFYLEQISYITFQVIRLDYSSNGGSSWSEIDAINTKTLTQSGSAGQNMRINCHLRFVVPSWSGERRLRLTTTGTHWHSAAISMHALTKWDGSSSSTDFANTSLIVYNT
jgi:hypothetical protein